MTPQQVMACTGCRDFKRATAFAPVLEEAMTLYGIDTPERMAAFLANVGVESGGLHYTSEIWGPTPVQSRYEGRHDLGNTEPGDGSKFRGHGLLQTTGRANHARVRDRLRERFPDLDVPDFEEDPDELCDPRWAALSAADYWDDHGLNDVIDAGDFDGVCDRINRGHKTRPEGDALGFKQRLGLFEAAKEALGA